MFEQVVLVFSLIIIVVVRVSWTEHPGYKKIILSGKKHKKKKRGPRIICGVHKLACIPRSLQKNVFFNLIFWPA